MIYEGLLLAGEPIKTDKWTIKQKTLRDLVKNDELEKTAISFLLMTAEDLGLEDEELKELPQFILLSMLCIYNVKLREQICSVLEYILDYKCLFEEGLFLVEDKFLDESDWEEIKEVFFAQRMTSEKELLRQNSREEFKPANEEARAAMERFRDIHNEINALKSRNKKTSEPLMRLINAFCAKSPNTNILEVWNLTYYQFRMQFDQIIRTDDYEKTFAQLMAGADPKKLKLVHWTE